MSDFTKVAPGHSVRSSLLKWIDGQPHFLREAKIIDLTRKRYVYGDWECANEWVTYHVIEVAFVADISDGRSLNISYTEVASDHQLYEDVTKHFSRLRVDLEVNGEKVENEKLLAFVKQVVKQAEEFTVNFSEPVFESPRAQLEECA